MIRTVISKVELVGMNMIVWTIHCNLLQLSLKSTHREEVTFFFWAQIAHVDVLFYPSPDCVDWRPLS